VACGSWVSFKAAADRSPGARRVAANQSMSPPTKCALWECYQVRSSQGRCEACSQRPSRRLGGRGRTKPAMDRQPSTTSMDRAGQRACRVRTGRQGGYAVMAIRSERERSLLRSVRQEISVAGSATEAVSGRPVGHSPPAGGDAALRSVCLVPRGGSGDGADEIPPDRNKHGEREVSGEGRRADGRARLSPPASAGVGNASIVHTGALTLLVSGPRERRFDGVKPGRNISPGPDLSRRERGKRATAKLRTPDDRASREMMAESLALARRAELHGRTLLAVSTTSAIA